MTLGEIASETQIEWTILKRYESPDGQDTISLRDASLVAQCCGVKLSELLPEAEDSEVSDCQLILSAFVHLGKMEIRQKELTQDLEWSSQRMEAAISSCDAKLRALGCGLKQQDGYITLRSHMADSGYERCRPADTLDELSEMRLASQVLSRQSGLPVTERNREVASRLIEEGVLVEINGKLWADRGLGLAVDQPVPDATLVQRYYEELEFLEPRGRPSQVAKFMTGHWRQTSE